MDGASVLLIPNQGLCVRDKGGEASHTFGLCPRPVKGLTGKCNDLTPVRWLSPINPQTTSAGQDVGEREPSCTVDGNADWCSHCGKHCGIAKNTNKKWNCLMIQQFKFWESIGRNPNTDLKDNRHPTFIAALFTTAKIWKQPRCPSVDEWI